MYSILGGGLAGLSASYHLGHQNCTIFEKNSYLTGHIHTEIIDGFTWG
jgi:protoporphyrinogen oxidase